MKFIIYAILTQGARAENLKRSICHFLTNNYENYEFGGVRLNKL